MGTIRVYRHPVGTAPANPTLVTQFDDADGGAFSSSFTVDAGTLPAGTYDITVTNQDTGKAVSGHSNALDPPLAVNAAGVSDNFNRADTAAGAGVSGTWTNISPYGSGFYLGIRSNTIAAVNSDYGAAQWSGAALGTDRTVIARLGPGTAGVDAGPELLARFTAGATPGTGDKFISAMRRQGGTQWKFEAHDGTSQLFTTNYTGTDNWTKIVLSGTTATFYTSTDGTTWTQRYTQTNAGLATVLGEPAFRFYVGNGYGAGDATTYYADDFSAV